MGKQHMIKRVLRSLAILLGAIVFASGTAAAYDPENTLFLDLKDGRVVIEMKPELAPNHVARIKELVRQGFYDGVVFHRVIDGFMAQTGDPTGTGSGGSGTRPKAEVNGEIGNASVRERVCQYVYISVGAASLQKK